MTFLEFLYERGETYPNYAHIRNYCLTGHDFVKLGIIEKDDAYLTNTVDEHIKRQINVVMFELKYK